MELGQVLVALFAVATGVAMLARRINVPYTVALVLAGVALGRTHVIHAPQLTKELVFSIFLPGLLFEASFNLEFKKFWQNKLAIHALAIPGVLAAILLPAALLTPIINGLHFVHGFQFAHAMVFAAVLSATDPIAVVALFKSLGAPKRLTVLVEGESLFNDGTAVVFFTLVLAFAMGEAFSPGKAVVDFFRVAGLGVVVGSLFGLACSQLLRYVDDPMLDITLTTIAAYGSFVLAERFHVSGVMATVAAGMWCGSYGANIGMSPVGRIAVHSFWEYIAFALNSVIFLLIGFAVSIDQLIASWKPILVAFAIINVARAAVVGMVSVLLRPTSERLPWSWTPVLVWGGLRGGLSMVLALGLPSQFPHRELIVTMTFGVVVLSILVQGMTMAPLLRKLKLVGLEATSIAYDRQRGTILSARAALVSLEKMVSAGLVPVDIAEDLRRRYQETLAGAEERLLELAPQASERHVEQQRTAHRQLFSAQKDAILQAVRVGSISQDAAEELLAEIDLQVFKLESGEPLDAPEGPKVPSLVPPPPNLVAPELITPQTDTPPTTEDIPSNNSDAA